MTMTAPNTAPKTNLAAKSALARLMAAEDIVVEVDPTAPTASFNVEERRLVLPLWDVEGDAYDMLVGHEVSHALYSPEGAEALWAGCRKVDEKNVAVAKDYLNVVEDARIERLIKIDYPGLKRSFAAGYREFNARDIFGIKGKEVANLALIDRINLHYKIGWLVEVPFTAAELPLVQRVAETRTWDDVVALTKEIYEFAKKQKQQEQQKSKQQKSKQQKSKPQDGEEQETEDNAAEAGGSDEEGEEGDEDGKEAETDSTEDGESEDGDEDGKEGKGKGKPAEAEDKGDEADAEAEDGDEADADGEGTTDSTEDDTDDGESAESEEAEGKVGSEDATAYKGDGSETVPDASETAKAMQAALDNMAKNTKRPMVYAELPEMPKEIVVPFTAVEEAFGRAAQAFHNKNSPNAVLTVWKNKNQSDVLALATEFERRKAADAHRRTVTAETGALDPTRLFAYKISDDIFLRSSTVKDGKNHGLIILLDMSGSMSAQMLDTVVQLVNLTAFARRVNIPYKVYGFVDYKPEMAVGNNPVWKVKKGSKPKWRELTNPDNPFRLLTLLESGTTMARWQAAASHLLLWATSLTQNASEYHKAATKGNAYYEFHRYYHMQGFRLNGTPTNQALMALLTLVPEFKKKHALQVVNTVILTDGEAGDMPLTSQFDYADRNNFTDRNGYPVEPLIVVRDPLTRRDYKVWEEVPTGGGNTAQRLSYSKEQQKILAAMLRDRTGAKVININLVTGVRMLNQVMYGAGIYDSDPKFKAVQKTFRDNGFVALPNAMGFDELIALNTANATDVAFDFDSVTVDTSSKAGQKQLQKAFVKSLESRKGNRPLMARIAELVSKNL